MKGVPVSDDGHCFNFSLLLLCAFLLEATENIILVTIIQLS